MSNSRTLGTIGGTHPHAFTHARSRVCICAHARGTHRHEKRRLLRTEFARALGGVLQPGGLLYVSSDAAELAATMHAAVKTSVFLPASAGHFSRMWATAVNADTAPSADADTATSVNDDAALSVDADGWLTSSIGNPFGVPTERDRVCEVKWRTVHRALWQKPRLD